MRINGKKEYDELKNTITMNNLKEIRKQRGWGITKTAIISNLTDSTITAYENGYKIPSLTSLISLSNVFNCSCDYLLDRTDNPLPLDKIDKISNNKNDLLLLSKFNSLSEAGKVKLEAYLQGLLEFDQPK